MSEKGLIDCPACGKKISIEANACPGCGQPVTEELRSKAKNKANVDGIGKALLEVGFGTSSPTLLGCMTVVVIIICALFVIGNS